MSASRSDNQNESADENQAEVVSGAPGIDDEPEFSLTQLSEAYAEVIEAQTGVRPTIATAESDSIDGDCQTSDADQTNAPNDDAACPISPRSIIEAILFVGAPQDTQLTVKKIASVLRDVSPQEVKQIIQQLNDSYQTEQAAYRIRLKGQTAELVLDDELASFQQEFYGRNRQVKLSQAAVEVMALVAYNQPITRDQIDRLRNKPSRSVLNQLIKRELVAEQTSDQQPGKKFYGTAERFLDLFQLDSIADLPQTHDVSDIVELAD